MESGRFGTASDYLGELILRDREDSKGRSALVGELEYGEASERRVPDILSTLRRELGVTPG